MAFDRPRAEGVLTFRDGRRIPHKLAAVTIHLPDSLAGRSRLSRSLFLLHRDTYIVMHSYPHNDMMTWVSFLLSGFFYKRVP